MKFFKPKVRLNICFKCRSAYEIEKRSFAEYCRLCSEPMVAVLIREQSIVAWAKENQEIVGKLMDEDKEKKKNELEEYYKNSLQGLQQSKLTTMDCLSRPTPFTNQLYQHGGI